MNISNIVILICSCNNDNFIFYGTIFLGPQEGGGLKSPGTGRGQRGVIDGLSDKSALVAEPWERLLEIVGSVGLRCEWQGEKGTR